MKNVIVYNICLDKSYLTCGYRQFDHGLFCYAYCPKTFAHFVSYYRCEGLENFGFSVDTE